MYFVEYYYKSKLKKNSFFKECGDRSVVILDGRNKLSTMKNDAERFNGHKRPKYDGYIIYKGDRFSDAKPITGLIEL